MLCISNIYLVMVLEKLIPMSRSTKTSPLPEPPSLKEILEDLERSNRNDVTFANADKLSIGVEEVVSEEKSTKKSSYKGQEKDQKTAGKLEIKDGKSNKEVYEKVTLLLKEHQALVDAQQTLKTLGPNLELEKSRMQESVDRVKQSWNVQKEKGR